MGMDMDEKFHIHGKPADDWTTIIEIVSNRHCLQIYGACYHGQASAGVHPYMKWIG